MPSCLQEFDAANDKIGAGRNPQEKKVVYFPSNSDAAPPKWKIDEARLLASPQWPLGGTPSEFLWTPSVHRGPTLGQHRRHTSSARGSPALPGPADRICSPSRESWRQPYQTTSSECTATQSCKRSEVLISTMRSDNGLLRGSSWDSRRTVWSKLHSAQTSRA